MKQILAFVLFFLIYDVGISQNPDWTDPIQRRSLYPEDVYLTGFSSEVLRKTESIDELRQKHLGIAKAQLVESISVNIKSSATLNLENLNSQSLEQFKQASVSFSEAKFSGLKTENWYDEKRKIIYVFAYVRISELIRACKADIVEKSGLLKRKIDAADAYATAGNLEQALKSYYQCFPIIRDIEQNEAMLVAIGKEPMPRGTENDELRINKSIANLRKERIHSLDDVCILMSDGIWQQLEGLNFSASIALGSFTYRDSRAGSEFSSRLVSCLEQKMVRRGFTIGSALNRDNEKSISASAGLLFSGTYWEEGENLKIVGNLRSLKTNNTIAGVEELLPKQWCNDNSVKYLADNYQQAVSRQKQFAENEIVGQGMIAELWTNQGKDNPIFKQGDTMRVYIRVSQPCFIRLIYYFSDGTRTLLLDNRFIGDDKIGQTILLPDQFVCDAPFGSETIQLIAQSGPFKQLTVSNKDGYKLIIDDVGSILANVRGMKPIGQLEFITEKRLDLTTLPH